MKNDKSDRDFDSLVFRALVPRGFRPITDAEIERMLDGLDPAELSDSKLNRMLGKVKGDIPKAWEEPVETSVSYEADSADARELAELYRARGEVIPPELEEKLRKLENEAAENDLNDGDSDVG